MILKNTDNAVIRIVNRQSDDEGSDVVNVEYSGRFYMNNGKFYIMYNEGDGISCMIRAEKNKVTVNRSGAASSVMVCEQGTEHSFLYKTQYGAMQMRVKTDKADILIGENGGDIRLSYVLYVNGGNIKNNMDISVSLKA